MKFNEKHLCLLLITLASSSYANLAVPEISRNNLNQLSYYSSGILWQKRNAIGIQSNTYSSSINQFTPFAHYSNEKFVLQSFYQSMNADYFSSKIFDINGAYQINESTGMSFGINNSSFNKTFKNIEQTMNDKTLKFAISKKFNSNIYSAINVDKKTKILSIGYINEKKDLTFEISNINDESYSKNENNNYLYLTLTNVFDKFQLKNILNTSEDSFLISSIQYSINDTLYLGAGLQNYTNKYTDYNLLLGSNFKNFNLESRIIKNSESEDINLINFNVVYKI